MACITIGLDTSRVYNKKQPPGGACADLFGDHPQPADNNAEQPSKVPPIQAAAEPTRSVQKSQPSPPVCTVTGETNGDSLPTPQAATKTETDKISTEPATERKQEILADSKNKEENISIPEKREVTKGASDIPEIRKAVVAKEEEALTALSPAMSSPLATDSPSLPVTATPQSSSATDSSSPAPPVLKTRRVPPGGHTHALW
eukprot:TRINITY_DN35975_c0_g1_i1.p1 TRINITY_DN35975_c0_g1~~TRINITY_DN35975_c0_g1_i1.p1  ORF type:complete len:202 (+),score=75.92 TRINITY_DN35975_c0_g1_i1:59-664(+)